MTAYNLIPLAHVTLRLQSDVSKEMDFKVQVVIHNAQGTVVVDTGVKSVFVE